VTTIIMDLSDTRIETKRLVLVPIDLCYADEIFRGLSRDITQYMFPRPAQHIGETLDFINRSLTGLADSTNLQMVIVAKGSNEFIGCAGLHYIGTINPELGIWTKKSAHGHGYGLEAITGLVNWARLNLDFGYMRYPMDRRNYPSRRIALMNGGIIQKEYREVNQSGYELELLEYWITK